MIESGASSAHIAGMSGHGDVATIHFFNRSVRVMTALERTYVATIAMMVPLSTAMTPVPQIAQSRRMTPAGLYVAVGMDRTAIPSRPRASPRGVLGVALAVFLQPRHNNASMERPTIQAALVENSLTDTQSRIVPVSGADVRAPSPTHRFWAIPLAAIGLVALAAVTICAFLPTSTFSSIKRGYAVVPASAEEVESRLSFTEAKRYPSEGQFLFVTIRQPQLSVLSWLMFGYDRNPKVKDTLLYEATYGELFGEQTPQQQSAGGRRQMVSAKQAAEYVALNRLGFPIDLQPGEIIIDSIVCLKANEAQTKCTEFAPSGKVLKAEDKLLKLDGKVIESVGDIAPILTNFKPGDLVDVEYDRPGSGTQTGQIEVIASPDNDGRTIVGFYPVDTTRVGKEPFTVNIDTEGIGGPSAGLAFTLTLIDELTPGELTGGNKIAVTGTMNVKGQVGAIGGLPQKALAVTQTGAKYFLVPASQSDEELAEARANAPDLTIIPVATVDEALAALGKTGWQRQRSGHPGRRF